MAAVAAQRLRALIAARMPSAHPGLDTEDVLRVVAPSAPIGRSRELADLLRSLDEARFGQTAFPDAVGLARVGRRAGAAPRAGGRVTFARPWLLLLLLGLARLVVAPPPERGAGRALQRRHHSRRGERAPLVGRDSARAPRR